MLYPTSAVDEDVIEIRDSISIARAQDGINQSLKGGSGAVEAKGHHFKVKKPFWGGKRRLQPVLGSQRDLLVAFGKVQSAHIAGPS